MKGVEVWLHLFLTSEQFGGKCQLLVMAAFPRVEESKMHIELEAGWAPDLVFTFRRREKTFDRTGN